MSVLSARATFWVGNALEYVVQLQCVDKGWLNQVGQQFYNKRDHRTFITTVRHYLYVFYFKCFCPIYRNRRWTDVEQVEFLCCIEMYSWIGFQCYSQYYKSYLKIGIRMLYFLIDIKKTVKDLVTFKRSKLSGWFSKICEIS